MVYIIMIAIYYKAVKICISYNSIGYIGSRLIYIYKVIIAIILINWQTKPLLLPLGKT